MFIYTNNERLKEELKKSIIDNRTTGAAIAEKLGITPQTYQHLINKKQFSFADMKRICDAMDCELVIDIVRKSE